MTQPNTLRCGGCEHFKCDRSICHFLKGYLGECKRAEGECQNERRQYSPANEMAPWLDPRARYETDVAGAHYRPREAKGNRDGE